MPDKLKTSPNKKLYPTYLNAWRDGSLEKTISKTFKLLENCSLCPRQCKINRVKFELGFCKIGLNPKVYSYFAHHGEEPPISGAKGSGTIFFSGCNMACAYCQNYIFSQTSKGKDVTPEELALFMLKLQNLGCHNINLVTPTHVLAQILKALSLAIPKGLAIPLVYNTSGYELAEIIKLLDGIIDIYLTDMRYANSDISLKYSSAKDYPQQNQKAVKEMHRQTGIAQFDKKGIIKSGVIIRHLVLPENASGTEKIMKFIRDEISTQSYISLMSQYLPTYKANNFKQLSRRISLDEYAQAVRLMEEYGLSNGWTQESGGLEELAGIHIKPMFKKDA